MADTIITNTPDSSDSSAGIVLAIIFAVLAIGGFVLYQQGVFQAAPEQAKSDTTEINVTLPEPPAATPTPTE